MGRRRAIDHIELQENHLNPWDHTETTSRKEILKIKETENRIKANSNTVNAFRRQKSFSPIEEQP